MIDFHMHFCDRRKLSLLLDICSELNINKAGLVSLPDLDREEGSFNSETEYALRAYPERFLGFGALNHHLQDTRSTSVPDYSSQVAEMSEKGFRGIKTWLGKPLSEKLFKVSTRDEGIQESFSAAGELSMPVLYHVADPPDFWDPGKLYGTDEFSPFDRYIEDALYTIDRHPGVIFIFAHLMFLADRLDELDTLLVRYPNIYLDTAPGRWFYAVLDERRDQAVRFFEKHSGRLLMGSDTLLFPDDFSSFGNLPDKGENIRTITRIRDYLAGTQELDNPYPSSSGKKPRVTGLGLSHKSIDGIFQRNAEKFFLD